MSDLAFEKQNLFKLNNYANLKAKKGDPDAQSYLAEAFFWGWGCEQSYSDFIKWDILAAHNGSPVSARRMFLYYLSNGRPDLAGELYYDYTNNSVNAVDLIKLSSEIKVYGINAFLNFSAKSSTVLEFIDKYEQKYDLSEENREKDFYSYLDEFPRSEEPNLFRGICYLFGFGTKIDCSKAFDYFKSIKYSYIQEPVIEGISYMYSIYEINNEKIYESGQLPLLDINDFDSSIHSFYSFYRHAIYLYSRGFERALKWIEGKNI